MATAKTTTQRRFTTKALDALKAKPTRTEYRDALTPGLRLRVEPTGRKSFVWYYKDDNRTRVLTLGRYGNDAGQLSLKSARKHLEQAKRKRQAGEKLSEIHTVKDAADVFYKRRIAPHRKRPEIARGILDKDILPAIGDMALSTVTIGTVSGVVEGVVDRGASTHAKKVLGLLKQLFKFAEGRGYIDRSPAYALDPKNLGVTDNIRDRFLNAEELKAIWYTIENAPRISVQVRTGLKILILSGVRTAELLNARWENIDFEKAEWVIPLEDSKTVAWTVPLTDPVLALFRELQDVSDSDDDKSPWVMATDSKSGRLSDKALARALHRMFELLIDDKGNINRKHGELLLDFERCVPHDFRRTMRTTMDDLGIEPHISEKCLNHSLGRIEKTYNKNTLLMQRREALSTWADWVAEAVGGDDNG